MLEKYIEMFKEDVVRVKRENIENIPRELIKNPYKILYFEDVNGYHAVGNLWSKRERFKKIIGDNLIERMIRSIETRMDYDTVDFDMKKHDLSLLEFPFPKYFEGDGGRYITSGVVFSEYEGKKNASFHRIMLLDSHRGVIRLVPRDLYTMYKKAIEHGEELKFTLAIGLEPNVLIAAATSVDYSIDEMKIASSLKYFSERRKEIMMPAPNGIYVPYNSELILEGRITNEFVDEGPFLDITKTYDKVRKQPVVVFERAYHRGEPIFHLLLPGGYEHYNLMGLPREPTIFREIKKEGIDILDVRLTHGGCSWLHGVVKIRKKNEEDGRKAIIAAFRGHKSLKHVVVVDEDINIDNMEDVEYALATRFQGDRDLIVKKERGSSLDPSAYKDNITTKIGFDATVPLSDRKKFERVKF